MHSVDLLEEAIAVAAEAGFEVRQEWLAESTGGACRIGNKYVLYVDQSLTAADQLKQVIGALRECELHSADGLSRPLRELLTQ